MDGRDVLRDQLHRFQSGSERERGDVFKWITDQYLSPVINRASRDDDSRQKMLIRCWKRLQTAAITDQFIEHFTRTVGFWCSQSLIDESRAKYIPNLLEYKDEFYVSHEEAQAPDVDGVLSDSKERSRSAFQIWCFENVAMGGMKCADAAVLCGKSEGSVRNALSKARRDLRTRLRVKGIKWRSLQPT